MTFEQALVAVLDGELDEHGYEDDDEKRGQVAHHFARCVLESLGLTEETNAHYGDRYTDDVPATHRRLITPWQTLT